MSTLQEYKCPCCDGAIAFDSTLQKLACPYCGSEFEPETLASYDEALKDDSGNNMKWEENPGNEWQEDEAKGLCSYRCNSCGGEIITDMTTAASKCPYCENPVVMMEQFSGGLKPDLVIPFKIDKKSAKQALLSHCKGKKLLPAFFRDENRIDEIKGVYVPFWLFDAKARAKMCYKATKVRFWSDMRFDYTETSYYNVTRAGSLDFEKVPVDGSLKMPDELMESIEPFDFSQAVDFQTAYLAGFFADKYDATSEQCSQRANDRITKTTADTFASTVQGYTTVVPMASSINLEDGKSKYALLPVWLLNTTWKGQKYTFAMNGQTGKFVGNLPLDKAAYKKWLFGLTGAIGAVCFVLMYLLWIW